MKLETRLLHAEELIREAERKAVRGYYEDDWFKGWMRRMATALVAFPEMRGELQKIRQCFHLSGGNVILDEIRPHLIGAKNIHHGKPPDNILSMIQVKKKELGMKEETELGYAVNYEMVEL